MIHTRERYEDKVGYDRNQENTYDYRDVSDREQYATRHNYYAQNPRATEDDRYTSAYEDNSYTNRGNSRIQNSISDDRGYNYADDTYVETGRGGAAVQSFQPIEISDVASDNRMLASKSRNKSKTASKMTGKSKLFIAVYFGLVAVIITMLLINAIPSVGAQAAAAPDVIVNNGGYENAMDSILSSGSTVAVPPYNYNTNTNWFDSFCDFMGGLFS